MMYGWGRWGMMGGYYPNMWWWLLPLVILDMILRLLALWKSAQRHEKWWFVALLLVNSVGILPGIYLLTHPETKPSRKSK